MARALLIMVATLVLIGMLLTGVLLIPEPPAHRNDVMRLYDSF